ncbi:hypothetical protein SAMN05421776_102198 [Nocardia farcinica]|uniref:Uncharacterized protein n=1 Tax=Nocardia farcinica TaxID=37329 RepID=A0A0H5NTC0_NOCFR|nr:hypothetical protein [Nocardia farcinica]AXK86030.1 hypothetical protein DXT66_10745 [Nocardia farcinica]PFX00300.1 hypothetical protein CJ469_04483 [Nocardia farcinica]PFX07828.1 hypothetical protein CJ468_03220 [Nocardia farcinica]CRY78299.1 Uncharacterised protein [Nocardia farcinica]SIS90368.1 hypothetical protein SAMN05421776_102198 [Nocardia farcinica]
MRWRDTPAAQGSGYAGRLAPTPRRAGRMVAGTVADDHADQAPSTDTGAGTGTGFGQLPERSAARSVLDGA